MANQQIKRLLRRRPELDEAELELLQSRVLARLRGPADPDPAAETPPTASDVDPAPAAATSDDLAPDGRLLRGPATTYRLPENAVGVMAEPGAAVWEADLASLPQPLADAEDAPALERAFPVMDVELAADALVVAEPTARKKRGRSPRDGDGVLAASSTKDVGIAVITRAEAASSQPAPSTSFVVGPKPRRPKATKTARARPRRRTTEAAAIGPEPASIEPYALELELEPPAPEVIARKPETVPETIVATPTWLAKATTVAKGRPGRRTARSEAAVAEPVQQTAATEATEPAFEAPEPVAITAEPVSTTPRATTAEPASFEPTVATTPGPRLAQAARAAKARLRRRTPWPITLDPEPDAPEPEVPEPEASEPEASEPVAAADQMPLEADSRPVLEPTAPAPAKAARRRPTNPAALSRRAAATHAAVAPYCPYCALLLDPPPEATRRCPRCRERIIVKRADGRTIYLTEASVLVFDAERLRMAHAGHWTRERGRWLKVAAEVGAPADRIAKLESAPLSEELVRAAHALYSTTVDRSFRTAKRERRWDDAARIMREHAQVLFRLAGSPIRHPMKSIRAHQQAAVAALHGVAEMAREAELVGVRCCSICTADHGQTFRIASELRTRRLPHAGCPKGLCRCDWYLAVRDQGMVRRHLRRRAQADVPAAGASG